ncbi:Thioredoxin [Granulicella pectinivorans]|uniref:Thioredoxin n=1 Tax=Granulicella pectinivorans TaxID=474950 RepID=A0A1I6LM86_9BACT|nr:thioredoxin domain-containing protein [Granulicella pectinivorans]SFS04519.1 Thioredoxin [Granulicella pectinivorans]
MNRRLLTAAFALSLFTGVTTASAQSSAPENTGNNFKDTSLLKPPAGSRVAIIEFEDLECPACARAFPMVHAAVDHYKIPLQRHDFPLAMHVWSFDAAVNARYLQDKVSPSLAEEYRRAVFASQTAIASKDDLSNFTRKFFQSHGTAMPFVIDPTGQFTREVKADFAIGERIGISQTPTIWVVTANHWTQITDPTLLYQTIDAALAETAPRSGAKTVARHK